MNASLYSPDSGLVPPYVAQLSQRDLSYTIPINFVPQPGVSLSAACFANLRYEDAAATRCISNLLAAGFRRLEADVFWDASRSHWSLCPLELGNSSPELTTSGSVPAVTELVAVPLSVRQNNQLTSQSATTSLTSVSIADASNTVTVSADATTTALDGTGTSTAYADGSAIQIGGYTCTPSTDFDLLLSILSARLTDTATDLNASTVTLSLNVHAAAPASVPLGSAQQPSNARLPSLENSLSSVISRNLSSRVYTPTDLLTQRNSLNSSQSWFTVNPAQQPVSAYFEVDSSNGISSSPDGWPSEGYIEMSAAKRVLIEFGRFDPQMMDYNLSMDATTIFPSRYLAERTSPTFSSNGTIVTGCFFDPNDMTVANSNNSFALNSVGNGTASQDNLLQELAQAKSLTNCGISPFLNATLAGSTADENFTPYLAFVQNTIWSWGPDQPTNASLSDEFGAYRCAALNATSGTWLAADCGSSRYGACRISSQPYGWKITYADAPYDRIDLACDDGSAFALPRTPLENANLLSVWRAYRNTQDDDKGPLLWLDFNQLDISACWVSGQNTTCPYARSMASETRRIAVPVVGAIIVFVLAALTVLIKCAGNRQTAKRRKRRGNDGWDYEGVPS